MTLLIVLGTPSIIQLLTLLMVVGDLVILLLALLMVLGTPSSCC